MENKELKKIIEAILFATGRVVTINELVIVLEISAEEIISAIENLRQDLLERGINIIKVNDGYQMCSNPKYYDYICQIIDKRTKPKLSNAALETLAIIAYNPNVTRAEIESIRGVSADASIYKLLEYTLIEDAGKMDAPGRPTMYKTTENFLKMFGFSSLEELPELPRYKLDENNQIVIDDIQNEENIKENAEKTNNI